MKLLKKILRLPFVIQNSIKWVKTLNLANEGKFSEAYKLICSTSNSVRAKNIEHLLMRGYLAKKVGVAEDAANCFEAFFSLIEVSDCYSPAEKHYLKQFAAFHYIPLILGGVASTTSMESLKSTFYIPPELEKIRSSLKRKFFLEWELDRWESIDG